MSFKHAVLYFAQQVSIFDPTFLMWGIDLIYRANQGEDRASLFEAVDAEAYNRQGTKALKLMIQRVETALDGGRLPRE